MDTFRVLFLSSHTRVHAHTLPHIYTYRMYVNASYYTGPRQKVEALHVDNPVEKSIIRSVNNHVIENRSAERACITSRPVMRLTASGSFISSRWSGGAREENKNTKTRVGCISHKQRMFISKKKKNDNTTHMEMTRNQRRQISRFFFLPRWIVQLQGGQQHDSINVRWG